MFPALCALPGSPAPPPPPALRFFPTVLRPAAAGPCPKSCPGPPPPAACHRLAILFSIIPLSPKKGPVQSKYLHPGSRLTSFLLPSSSNKGTRSPKKVFDRGQIEPAVTSVSLKRNPRNLSYCAPKPSPFPPPPFLPVSTVLPACPGPCALHIALSAIRPVPLLALSTITAQQPAKPGKRMPQTKIPGPPQHTPKLPWVPQCQRASQPARQSK